MPRFAYQVRDNRGSCSKGVLKAPNADDAARQLRSDGGVILELQEQRPGAAPAGAPKSVGLFGPPPVKRDDIIFFANQLAIMVDTGVPLSDALDAIYQQTTSLGLRAVLEDVNEQVRGGMEFSRALARHPKSFEQLFVSMVRASEATGTLGKMLQRVAGYLEQQRQLRKRVKGAMAYPVMMLVFCIFIVVGMLIFILPRFEKIYAGKKAALPVPTQFLLSVSNGLINHWGLILGLLVAAIAGIIVAARTDKGKDWADAVRLNTPILGNMARKAALARSLRTLATMVASGVSVLEGLDITSEVAGSLRFARMWRGLIDELKQGSALADELYDCKLMPQSITQMVAAGERTGKLGTVLDRVATFCEEDLDITIRTVTSFIEPVMIMIMGVVVGGIAMALLLPVFSISKVMAGR